MADQFDDLLSHVTAVEQRRELMVDLLQNAQSAVLVFRDKNGQVCQSAMNVDAELVVATHLVARGLDVGLFQSKDSS